MQVDISETKRLSSKLRGETTFSLLPISYELVNVVFYENNHNIARLSKPNIEFSVVFFYLQLSS